MAWIHSTSTLFQIWASVAQPIEGEPPPTAAELEAAKVEARARRKQRLSRLTGKASLQVGMELGYMHMLPDQYSELRPTWIDLGGRLTGHLLWRPFRARLFHVGLDLGYIFGHRQLSRACIESCRDEVDEKFVHSWGDLAHLEQLRETPRLAWQEHGMTIGPRIEFRWTLKAQPEGPGKQIAYAGPPPGVQLLAGAGMQFQLTVFDRRNAPNLMRGDRRYRPENARWSSADPDFSPHFSVGLAYRARMHSFTLRYRMSADSIDMGRRTSGHCEGDAPCRTHELYRVYHGVSLGFEWDVLTHKPVRYRYPQ